MQHHYYSGRGFAPEDLGHDGGEFEDPGSQWVYEQSSSREKSEVYIGEDGSKSKSIPLKVTPEALVIQALGVGSDSGASPKFRCGLGVV